MAKRLGKVLLGLMLLLPCSWVLAESSQTIQISTHFSEIIRPASWLLLIRDADSPAIYPYLFDITQRDNYYVIFVNARHYRITSIMQFPHYHSQISNYCHFPQSIISDLSLDLKISGVLTPEARTSDCVMNAYQALPYTVTKKDDDS